MLAAQSKLYLYGCLLSKLLIYLVMSLSPEEIAYEKAHISDDKTGQIVAANVVCGIVAVLSVALRFLSRRYANAHLGLDDWLLVVSLVFTFS